MHKKIGIITFHRADNLGAVLQAYALETTIERNIGPVEIIDYQCKMVEDTKRVKKCKTFKDCVRYFPKKLYLFIKHSGFENFRKEKLKVSQISYNHNNISSCINNYDIFIVGSDQVWNFNCSGKDMTYFLGFVPSDKKKISYAASIGECEYHSEDAQRVYNELKRFDVISTREETAKKQLEGIGVAVAAVLPDPVILLSDKEWQDIMEVRLCRKKYILVYMISEDVNVVKSATEYARVHNCKIINNKKSIEFIMHNSPAEFLSWVYYAECVFTNSFHGTAFSVIFNKPLCADVELKDGQTNSRVKDFLTWIKAEQCILDKENLQANIPDAKDTLIRLKELAMEYLKSNCQ